MNILQMSKVPIQLMKAFESCLMLNTWCMNLLGRACNLQAKPDLKWVQLTADNLCFPNLWFEMFIWHLRGTRSKQIIKFRNLSHNNKNKTFFYNDHLVTKLLFGYDVIALPIMAEIKIT